MHVPALKTIYAIKTASIRAMSDDAGLTVRHLQHLQKQHLHLHQHLSATRRIAAPDGLHTGSGVIRGRGGGTRHGSRNQHHGGGPGKGVGGRAGAGAGARQGWGAH